MNTKALRQKVLDLAIHGKLVPQNPNDESAEVLLKKIREEKAEKIKKGELKADKKDSFIFVGSDKRHYEQFADGTVKDIEDEIPFNIPEGWAWCRFSEVSINRDSERKPVNSSNRKNVKKIYDYYGAAGVIDKVEEYLFDEKLLLIGEDGANLLSRTKNNAFIACGKYWVNNHAHVIDCFDKSMLDYLCYYINAITLDEYITGSAQPKFTQKALNDLLLPLPALKEQQRIINTIERFFAKIDELELNKTYIQTAIKQAKSKILDLAIHGKLVPQDPNDEPAEELLKRIATSDNRPYKKFDGEEPFDIPALWSWCRLGAICDYGKCINVNSSDLKADDWILDLEDIEKDSGRIIAFHNFEERKSESTKHKFLKGQVLYSKLRPYLNKVVIAPKEGFCTSEILPLDFNSILLPRYAQVLLMSSYFLEMVNMVTYGVKMPRLGTNDAKNMRIPVPPLAEQQRIVTKIEELFSYLDTISSNLE